VDWSKVKFFKENEFACKCGCGFNNINPQLVLALDMARRDAGVPFSVSSGCRCEKHNKRVGGVSDSAHTKGLAVDVSVANSEQRYVAVRALLRYFTRIGVDKHFIHVDVDSEKVSPSMWVY
jgi:uncharacterized protein YcbK (DUF882 family)